MVRIDVLVFNAFQVNTFLVSDEAGNCLVVDPAFYTGDERRTFENFISDNSLNLKGQINTHCHVDHVLGAHYVKNNLGFPFRAHREESAILDHVPLMGDMYGLSVEPFEGIDQYLEDEQEITLGKHTLKAIHVPGHSAGSLAFYSREGEFVITGDALFNGSIGRTDLPGGDYDQLIGSIRQRLLVLPPETVVYPGHGPSSTILREATGNPFLNMSQ